MVFAKIAIIGGGSIFYSSVLRRAKPHFLSTAYGKAVYYKASNLIFINRHGPAKNIPPHKINHRANIVALKKLGVKYIFAFTSAGSLKKEITPGTFLVPDDYIELSPTTFFDNQRTHITPEISQEVRKILIHILKKLNLKFRSKGIYFESRGPRLETKAETKFIKNFADIVGMTMGKEATLAKELSLKYGSACSIDNFANGCGSAGKPPTQKAIEDVYKKNQDTIEAIIKEIALIKI